MTVSTADMPRSREGFEWKPKTGYSRGLQTPSVAVSTPESDLSSTYDVIIIGAGFAGLAAARDLAHAGVKVLRIEARDRIGGRTWTAYGENGEIFEMGGTWVHWQQPHVFAELQRYGLDDLVETQALPEGCAVFSKAMASDTLTIATPHEAAEMFAGTEALMAKFLDVDGQGGRGVIPFPYNTPSSLRANPSYLEVDKLSIQDQVDQLEDLSSEERQSLSDHAASFYGISADKAAFSEVLHTYALCNFQSEMIEESTMKFKLAQGTTTFAQAILNDFTGHRLFSSPVKSISQTEVAASVLLESGRKYVAQVVISTIPMNVVSSIQFDPPISSLRQSAFTQGIIAAKTDKLLATTSTNLPTGYNISCEGGDNYALRERICRWHTGRPAAAYLPLSSKHRTRYR